MSGTVFCVVPVHNRLETTRQCLEYLHLQDYAALQIVIIDDGSTDGTSEFLADCGLDNLTVLTGNGDLWWGGAMYLGVEHVSAVASAADYLLMLNDDVHIESHYVSTMVAESMANADAVVGSAQRDQDTGALIGCGCRIDYWGMRVLPVQGEYPRGGVDALPGRGALFPMAAVRRAGNINVGAFPHYLGDLEFSARIGELGWKIIISRKADIMTSAESSDAQVREQGMKQAYFSFRSKNNLWQRLRFFSSRGPLWLRIWAIPRYTLAGGFRMIRKLLS